MHTKLPFLDFQYIPPILSSKSPPGSPYTQASLSGIWPYSPLGEHAKLEAPKFLLIHTSTKFKGGVLFPNTKPIQHEEDLES
jgi:hypothetical protein